MNSPSALSANASTASSISNSQANEHKNVLAVLGAPLVTDSFKRSKLSTGVKKSKAQKRESKLLKKFKKKLFRHSPLCPWRIKLQADKVRKTFSTGRVRKVEAALQAMEIYIHLKEHGMQATLVKYGNALATAPDEHQKETNL